MGSRRSVRSAQPGVLSPGDHGQVSGSRRHAIPQPGKVGRAPGDVVDADGHVGGAGRELAGAGQRVGALGRAGQHVDINPAVPEIPTLVSLGVIVVILIITTVASLIKTRHDPTAKAHAGSIRAHKPKQQPAEGQSSELR